jgi:hypothetical protein
MKHVQCEHCSNPDKALWLTDCTYVGYEPGSDMPCYFDNYYDEGRRALEESHRKHSEVVVCLFVIMAVVLGIVGLAECLG